MKEANKGKEKDRGRQGEKEEKRKWKGERRSKKCKVKEENWLNDNEK